MDARVPDVELNTFSDVAAAVEWVERRSLVAPVVQIKIELRRLRLEPDTSGQARFE